MTTNNSIFKLIEIDYCDEKPQYPEFEVSRIQIGYFSSLANAEQAMKNNIKGNDYSSENEVFGYIIEEYALDEPSYWHTKSKRSFLPDGSFLDETLVSDLPDKNGDFEEFLGRPPEKVRFASGDLVELLRGDTVTLSIVTHMPSSPEEVSEMHQRSKKNHSSGVHLLLDASDDAYRTIEPDDTKDNDTHDHPHGIQLFPLRFSVSAELHKKCAQTYLMQMLSYKK
ncbi:MAG: hypothetical protein FWH18_12020 [Marinilabiliaceae bacterium]|nr:hypothetical protein [Marinilabiliaceae bacterium]